MKNPTVGKPGVNYYALLGVHSTATQDEITRSFRKRILQVHLDKMGPEDDSEVCYLTIEAHRILSDKTLRAKYDVERSSSKDYKAQQEVFIPAGYICYDVGHHQMSRQLLDSITNWTSEYDKCADELSDNYFHCFSQLVTQVMCDSDQEPGTEIDMYNVPKPLPLEHFYCGICEKNYITETHHWDIVVNPYRAMFYSDVQGISALSAYFQGLIGSKFFNWEPRYLPTRLLGIWGSAEWSMLTLLHQEASVILKECDYHPSRSPPSEDSLACTISKLESYTESKSKGKGESFLSSHTTFLRRSLIQNLVWVLENKEQVEQMMSRMSELICQDDLQEILCLGMAMRNVLSFGQSEWEQLIQDGLAEEQFELAMLWTMLAVESGDKSRGDWFQLGMTIRTSDPVLAHFCFLLSGCESEAAWEDLANIFTRNGAHYAAVEYHLNKGNLFGLLHKSRALQTLDPEGAAIYSGIYHATRIKGLLQVLTKRSRQCSSVNNSAHNAELEELIEIVQDLASASNPLEGFRIIVSTWPDVFEESPGTWVHRATIQFLRRGRINLKSAKLILAAAHFLPVDERLDEISHVSEEASGLTRELLERALETNDFELLTDVLLHLNKRMLATAEGYLEEINPPPPPPKVNSDEEMEFQEEEQDGDKENPPPHPPPSPPPQQQMNTPGHKSAMVLLLSGSIHKVKEEWLAAMKDYQNALLSAPECMHRVLPCVSKLVQDIQFHEAVVSQVQNEITELQRSLVNREYPDIDKYCSDQRPSLLLTDVAPKMDYGYKDCVAKIQGDPDKIPGPPPEDEPMEAPPPPPANTPMVTLDKNEEAIQSGQSDGQMDQLSAALAYVDLLKALPVQMHPGPIVMAASHFLRAMDDSDEMGKLYAYRNAIMLMAENLLRVDRKLQATIHHGLTHKHMLSILLSAHEKLSKALAAKKSEQEDCVENKKVEDRSHSPTSPEDDEVAGKNDKDKKKKDLIRKSEAHVISKFLKNVVNFPKVEPLASIPTLNCSDLVYVETLGNSFLSQFCADKVRQKHQSPLIPKHLHAYTHFVEVMKGRSTLSDFPQARVRAMEELLALRGWNLGDVERKMSWPFLTLQDGFSPPLTCLLRLRDPIRSYRSIDGFHIDYGSGTVCLLLSRDTLNPVDTLFDVHDIRDVVGLSGSGIMEKILFSLESPDPTLSSHPFREGKISIGRNNKGNHYNNSKFQQKAWSQLPESVQYTLSRVSMLLCYLASGLELSSETPFWMKRTDEGLLARLDEHLQYFARPISWRKAERKGEDKKSPFEAESGYKFWLNMVEVFEEIEEEDDDDGNRNESSILPQGHLTYRVGNMRTEVRPNTLVMTVDPTRKTHKLSPEAEFARDLTRHFAEFGRAFPELLRLEELVKISVVCSKLKQVLTENKALLQEYSAASCDNNKPAVKQELKGVSKVCSTIENFLAFKPDYMRNLENNERPTCNWFPAMFCPNNTDSDMCEVSAGVELDPVVTYGPVPPSPRPVSLPLMKVVNLDDDFVVVKDKSSEVEVEKAHEEKETVIEPAASLERIGGNSDRNNSSSGDEEIIEVGDESDGSDVSEEEESPDEVTDNDNASVGSEAESVDNELSQKLENGSDVEQDSDLEEDSEVEVKEESSASVTDYGSDEEQEDIEEEDEPEVEVEEAVTITIRPAKELPAESDNEAEDENNEQERVQILQNGNDADGGSSPNEFEGESEEEVDEDASEEDAEGEFEDEQDERVSDEEEVDENEVDAEVDDDDEEEEEQNGDLNADAGGEECDEQESESEEVDPATCDNEEVDSSAEVEVNVENGCENENCDLSENDGKIKKGEKVVTKCNDENAKVSNGSIPTKIEIKPRKICYEMPVAIDGKFSLKLKKDVGPSEENGKPASKRSFLSRRGKILLDKSRIVCNKEEQGDSCEEDSEEELILSK